MNSILHIMNYAASYSGNFIESLRNLDNKLKECGYRNVYLFCAAADNKDSHTWIDKMSNDGCPVFFLSEIKSEDVKLIRQIIGEYNVSLVHTHFITGGQYLTVKTAVGTKVPLFVHMHNHSKEATNILKKVYRKVLYRKSIMVSCSESVHKSVERDYPYCKKYYVDNGVNFNRLEDYKEITSEEYSIDESEYKLLIFGFDFYRKGVDIALKAMDKLRKEELPVNLLISLSCNFEYVEEQIKNILGENPSWVKVIKARNDVASLYNYVDVFLSPSREEGLPYSVVEAGYSNCSVVLSDISAQVNLKLKYGYWFESENVDELAEKIKLALEKHKDKLVDMPEVKKYMKANYSLESWSNGIMNIYKKYLTDLK